MSAATATPPPPGSPFLLKSPTRHESPLKPNPHPYAIKTTSTALLSRSNSSGHTTQIAHFYIPPHPSTSPTRSSTRRKSEYRGHRYSTSLSGSETSVSISSPAPAPIPFPDLFAHPQRSASDDVNSPPRRLKRSETLPSFHPTERETSTVGLALEDLSQPNPKLWAPAQLAAYLASALRVRSSTTPAVPEPVARDIVAWVRDAKISGRVFLRWGEEDLEALGVSLLWRRALLNASRNLRQNVLRGRIWGSPDGETSPTPGQPPASHPFSSDLYASSSSSLDLSMSGSEQGSPLRRTIALRIKKGRVKGMVDKWERESAGSVDGSDVEDDPVSSSPLKMDTALPDLSDGVEASASTHAVPTTTTTTATELKSEEEPSIEDLLAEHSDLPSGSWGARAWEDLDIGVTVKRLGDSEGLDTMRKEGSGSGSGRSSGSSSGGRVKAGSAKDERRVVTAIFEPALEETSQEEHALDEDVKIEDLANGDDDDDGNAKVQEMVQEVKETRNLLEEFRRRLEEVESKVREMEEREATRDAELATLRELETQREIETAQREASSVVAEVERAEREAQLDLELARLREVEKRAQELEALAASLVSAIQDPSPLARASLPEIQPEPQSFPAESMRHVAGPAAVLSRVVSRVHKRCRPQPDTTSSAADIFEPDSFSALPSYVLFVGLGVCAVVLRVVLKRTAGRQLRS